MLQRCEPNGFHQNAHPSYIGCSVHPDFIHFQEFAKWCQHQIGFGVDGFVLDKDILISGNRVYGPDTCVFVPSVINAMMAYKAPNGSNPIGASFIVKDNKFRATIRIDSKKVHLGQYETSDEAHHAYKVAKLNEIHRQANLYKDLIDQRAYKALMGHCIN